MKKISEILKDARVAKSLSIAALAQITKIKSGFIESIEQGEWEALPPFPTVLGFVKSIARALSIDENMATAVLKRDYPPKKLRVSPKPDVTTKFIWGPKLTFALGVSAVLVLLFGYLIAQYLRFTSPPKLVIESPKEGQVISSGSVNVFGLTETDAKITINNQPVEVSLDGKFNVTLDVAPETEEILIVASSRSGKITEVRRKIEVN